MPRRNRRLSLVALLLGGLLLATLPPDVRGVTLPDPKAPYTASPYTASPYTASPYKPAPYHPPVNKHLHGLEPSVIHGARTWVHSRYARRWNATVWFALHRGTGTIQGVVHNGQGEPLAGMTVVLRTPHGHALRHWSAKHVTSTGSGGTFVMTHVRAGRYRVRAERGGHSGHTGVAVHPNQIIEVSVKV